MAISDRNIDKNAKFARSLVSLELGVIGDWQAAKQTDSHVPGFAFEIVRVEVYALTVTATIRPTSRSKAPPHSQAQSHLLPTRQPREFSRPRWRRSAVRRPTRSSSNTRPTAQAPRRI
jgi:hypothetical protein